MTREVERAVSGSGLADGLATVFVVGSTAAVTTMEYEPGLVEDFPKMLERAAPKCAEYEHQKRWHDGNGHSHVKASLVGQSLTVPLVGGVWRWGSGSRSYWWSSTSGRGPGGS